MNGTWRIKINGYGKIHPADADEIQQLMVEFIATLTAAGHEIKSAGVKKLIGEDE